MSANLQRRDNETQTAFAIRCVKAAGWDECYDRYFGGDDMENPHADAATTGGDS